VTSTARPRTGRGSGRPAAPAGRASGSVGGGGGGPVGSGRSEGPVTGPVRVRWPRRPGAGPEVARAGAGTGHRPPRVARPGRASPVAGRGGVTLSPWQAVRMKTGKGSPFWP